MPRNARHLTSSGLAVGMLLLSLGACTDETDPTAPETEVQTMEARGGEPGRPDNAGPPSTLVLPQIGPLGGFPQAVPPGAGPPSFLSDIIEVASGGGFSCALRDDGVAFCWGFNGGLGFLGNGSPASSSVPVQVVSSERFARLYAGDRAACGLNAEGAAFCWGFNRDGLLGAGLGADRSLVPVPVAGGHRFVEFDIGLTNMCGVATDGLTYCWGSGSLGIMGPTDAGGTSDMPSPLAASAALGFVDVSVEFFHACGVDAGGRLHCWGDRAVFGNGGGSGTALAPEPAASGLAVEGFVAGIWHGCGIAAGGAAYCWGTANMWGQLGIGNFDTPVPTPTEVLGDISFASLDANDNNSVAGSTCGVSTTGEAWCWGNNTQGQLGVVGGGDCSDRLPPSYACWPAPVPVSGGLVVQQVSVGILHACALATDGTVWCWGSNARGALGDGSMVDSSTPVAVRGLDVEAVSAYVVVSPNQADLRLIGATEQLSAETFDLDMVPLPSQPEVSWSTSDPSIATVDAAGLVTSVGPGNATISATTPDGIVGTAIVRVDPIDPILAFKESYVGDDRLDGVAIWSGLLTDEFQHVGTFTTRAGADRRQVPETQFGVESLYPRLEDARRALEWDADRLGAIDPADPTVGEYITLAGFSYLAYAENFCSGVPLDDPDTGLSTTELFDRAVGSFEAALAGPIDPTDATAARVGLARARLGLGEYADAAAAVAGVPTDFVRATSHGGDAPNGIATLFDLRRLSVADGEGAVGLPFRSAGDPRVPWEAGGPGFDPNRPFYRLLKYPDASSDFPLATGIEAHLIEAEAFLQAGEPAAMFAVLDGLRASVGLPALVDPGAGAGQVEVLFRERGFWLYATAHRLGDVRRLMAQYGRAPDAVLPNEPYPFGGSYGTDANLPVPDGFRGASFSGCVDRTR